MRLSLSSNADKALADVDRFVDDVRHRAFRVAAPRIRDRARTAGLREIARIYGIGPRTMERFIRVSVEDTANGFAATISAKGQGFPLSAFEPIAVRGVGVSVKVKRRRFMIPGAFIATMASGRVGVFARGAYGGRGLRRQTGSFGRFKFGRGRRIYKGATRKLLKGSELPINELYTLSPGDALVNPDVVEAMAIVVDQQAGPIIKQAVRFGR